MGRVPRLHRLPALPTLRPHGLFVRAQTPHPIPKLSSNFPQSSPWRQTCLPSSRDGRAPAPRLRSAIECLSVISFKSYIVLRYSDNTFTNTEHSNRTEHAIARSFTPSRVSVRLGIMHIHLDVVVVDLIRCQECVDPILLVQKCRERLVGIISSSAHQPTLSARVCVSRSRNSHYGTPGRPQLVTTT